MRKLWNKASSIEQQTLLKLNQFIHEDSDKYEYHLRHLELVNRYLNMLNHRLDAHMNLKKMGYISYAHDILKERGLTHPNEDIQWCGHTIPQDLNRYVRMNLDVLEEYGLDDYFNTDVQLHALAAGIFIRKELMVRDPEILYPVMFHSCPIIDVYTSLEPRVQTLVDMTMLADKLSSNYLKINMLDKKVPCDLDLVVFGKSGREFNYTLGLYLARMLSQGNSKEEQSVKTTEFYYNRVKEVYPFVDSIKKPGGNISWEKRKSQAFKMQ